MYALTNMITSGTNPSKFSPDRFNAYRDEQKEIRNMINNRCVAAGRQKVFDNDLDDFSHYHVAVVGDGFKIVKRERPIDIVEYDNSGTAVVASNLQRTAVERIGLNRMRGKYNDGSLLAIRDACSIDLGEVQAASGGGGGYGAN